MQIFKQIGPLGINSAMLANCNFNSVNGSIVGTETTCKHFCSTVTPRLFKHLPFPGFPTSWTAKACLAGCSACILAYLGYKLWKSSHSDNDNTEDNVQDNFFPSSSERSGAQDLQDNLQVSECVMILPRAILWNDAAVFLDINSTVKALSSHLDPNCSGGQVSCNLDVSQVSATEKIEKPNEIQETFDLMWSVFEICALTFPGCQVESVATQRPEFATQPKAHEIRALTYTGYEIEQTSQEIRALTYPGYEPQPKAHEIRALTYPGYEPQPKAHDVLALTYPGYETQQTAQEIRALTYPGYEPQQTSQEIRALTYPGYKPQPEAQEIRALTYSGYEPQPKAHDVLALTYPVYETQQTAQGIRALTYPGNEPHLKERGLLILRQHDIFDVVWSAQQREYVAKHDILAFWWPIYTTERAQEILFITWPGCAAAHQEPQSLALACTSDEPSDDDVSHEDLPYNPDFCIPPGISWADVSPAHVPESNVNEWCQLAPEHLEDRSQQIPVTFKDDIFCRAQTSEIHEGDYAEHNFDDDFDIPVGVTWADICPQHVEDVQLEEQYKLSHDDCRANITIWGLEVLLEEDEEEVLL